MQDLGVAGVRRLAPEDVLRPRRATDLLVQVRVRQEPRAGAAGLRREMRRPQALCLRARAQLVDERRRLFVLAADALLVRVDVLLHERAIPRPELGYVLRLCEIGDGHRVSIAGVRLGFYMG